MEYNLSAEDVHRCSFCNKKQNEVKVLLYGGSAMICEECVGLCLKVLAYQIKLAPFSPEAEGTQPQSATPTPEDTAAPSDASSSEPSR